MKPKNRNEKKTIEVVYLNGTGTVSVGGTLRDVEVFAYFKMWRWHFIIHRDVNEPEYLVVSEASTGFLVKEEQYYTVEDALYFIIPYIESKHYHLATTVGNILVSLGRNLERRNTGNLQTLAINVLCM